MSTTQQHSEQEQNGQQGPQILDGRATAAAIKEELREQVAELRARGIVPGLGTVLVGDDPASHSYVKGKHRDCAEVGLASIRRDLPGDITQEELEAVIDELNADPACTGYIVQLPLPQHIDTNAILERIDPAKDADGLHPMNLGRLVLDVYGQGDAPLPCTPAGIVELIRRHGLDVKGKDVAVLGRGITVGRPLGLLLSRRDVNATVTLAHTGTRDLDEVLAAADIIVAAIGVGLSGLIARPLFSVASTYLVVSALVIGTIIVFALGGLAVRSEATTYSRPYDSNGNVDCESWDSYTYEAPRFDLVWWALAANPFVVLADATPTEFNTSGYPVDLYGQIKFGVRSAQLSPLEQRWDDCDPESGSQTAEQVIDETVPSWFVGLGVQVVLAGALFAGAWARTRTPARRLPPGTRIA